uniref:basic proline-rich protein-like n=1 Tax=Panthera onca TaxID=9690 RepID=UPI002954E76C
GPWRHLDPNNAAACWGRPGNSRPDADTGPRTPAQVWASAVGTAGPGSRPIRRPPPRLRPGTLGSCQGPVGPSETPQPRLRRGPPARAHDKVLGGGPRNKRRAAGGRAARGRGDPDERDAGRPQDPSTLGLAGRGRRPGRGARERAPREERNGGGATLRPARNLPAARSAGRDPLRPRAQRSLRCRRPPGGREPRWAGGGGAWSARGRGGWKAWSLRTWAGPRPSQNAWPVGRGLGDGAEPPGAGRAYGGGVYRGERRGARPGFQGTRVERNEGRGLSRRRGLSGGYGGAEPPDPGQDFRCPRGGGRRLPRWNPSRYPAQSSLFSRPRSPPILGLFLRLLPGFHLTHLPRSPISSAPRAPPPGLPSRPAHPSPFPSPPPRFLHSSSLLSRLCPGSPPDSPLPSPGCLESPGPRIPPSLGSLLPHHPGPLPIPELPPQGSFLPPGPPILPASPGSQLRPRPGPPRETPTLAPIPLQPGS